MSDKCPRCGASPEVCPPGFKAWACTSMACPDGTYYEGIICIERQLAQARERISELEQTINQIRESACEIVRRQPLLSEGTFYDVHVDGDGNEIATQPLDPVRLCGFLYAEFEKIANRKELLK